MELLTRRPLARVLPRLALLALLWLTLSGHVLSGCRGLFTPAIPETGGGEPIAQDYSSPEATLATLAAGIAGKGQGSSAYLGAFADSTRPDDVIGYHQVFDSADLQFFESACGCEAPTDWRHSQEEAFFLDFQGVRPSDQYAAQFDSVATNPDQPPQGSTAVLHRRYRVYANSVSGTSSIIIAIGFADLTFTEVSANRWLITRWDDHVDPTVGVNPTDPDQLTMGRRRLESTR